VQWDEDRQGRTERGVAGWQVDEYGRGRDRQDSADGALTRPIQGAPPPASSGTPDQAVSVSDLVVEDATGDGAFGENGTLSAGMAWSAALQAAIQRRDGKEP
jgi:hypothetical protein